MGHQLTSFCFACFEMFIFLKIVSSIIMWFLSGDFIQKKGRIKISCVVGL